MNTNEWVAVYLTIAGTVGTGFNIWLTLRIQNSILGLKLWSTDKFVSKDDMSNYLSPLKQSIQMIQSEKRLAE